jgi:outer membrane protein
MPQSTAASMRNHWRNRVLVTALLAGVAATVRAAPVDDLSALVESGRAAEAYVTYCANSDLVTRPEAFDLWCGAAAVDLGRAGEGVLTLERYVLRFPDSARGRLELARAYFYAGDDVRSREEFEAVSKEHPPPDVQAGIDRYLTALQSREGRYQTRTLAYAEVGGGYDSNANAGVAQAQIGLPVLGPVTVASVGVQKGSPFGWLDAGGRVNHPFAPGWSVFGAVDANGMFYSQASEFNLANGFVAAGGSYQSGGNVYSLSYANGEIMLAGSRYRWTNGLGFEWRSQVSERTSFALAPLYAVVDYSGENAVRNADLGGITASYRQIWLASTWQPILNASLVYGDEHDREGRPDLGYWIYGAAADLTVAPSSSWALNAGVAYVVNDYQGQIPVLDVTRRDRTFSANLSALYFIDRRWSVRAEYQYAHNASNLALYQYGRNVVALKLRYEFSGF